MTSPVQQTFHFKSQAETEAFAETLSLWAKPNLAIALRGDLGSGKSTFARAFIKALAKTSEPFDVPSPTFPLIQTYDNTRIPVAHVDLYRLSKPEEAAELGINELLNDHVVLVEWPELLGANWATSLLSLTLSGNGDERTLTLLAQGEWITALARNTRIESFIRGTDWHAAQRIFFEGDASSRRYETLNQNAARVILMDMPQRPDGPPVRDGKPYSAIAHLAESITSVTAVNRHLSALGYSAPLIENVDLDQGLAIIEDLGGEVYGRMMLAGKDMHQPMMTAVEVLADMTTRQWPSEIRLSEGKSHIVAPYDMKAQMIETDLLPSWFWPYAHDGAKPSDELHHSFDDVWRQILPQTQPAKPQWVLRDYHSPNLIWIPERSGLKRVGLIDTQDAVMGHAAYDLASMLQDARVDIDFDFADALFAHYVDLRSAQGGFDRNEFSAAYVILGAQRATKILGIFARLAKRDLKPQYLKHMPRVSRYLARNLKHEVLQPLRRWYEANMPEALKVGQA